MKRFAAYPAARTGYRFVAIMASIFSPKDLAPAIKSSSLEVVVGASGSLCQLPAAHIMTSISLPSSITWHRPLAKASVISPSPGGCLSSSVGIGMNASRLLLSSSPTTTTSAPITLIPRFRDKCLVKVLPSTPWEPRTRAVFLSESKSSVYAENIRRFRDPEPMPPLIAVLLVVLAEIRHRSLGETFLDRTLLMVLDFLY
mmetsp:Transcript_46121/g.111752  ORF Transcript_46121/g.111752 Transcript_46121/m.111752 type:complete len:200 (+) Transcript_46121:2050-2649(+)